MSSDGYFDDEFDDFDAAALDQIDAIEAAALGDTTNRPPQASSKVVVPQKQQQVISRPKAAKLAADSSFDMTFDFDEADLAKLDDVVAQAYQGPAKSIAGPSSRPFQRTSSSNMVQTTLFGGVVQPQASTSKAGGSSQQQQRSKPASSAGGGSHPFGKPAQKTKTWDCTAFSATGKKKAAKGKGKGRQEEDDEEEADDFELPAPFVPSEYLARACRNDH